MVTSKKKFDSHLKEFEEALRISIEQNLRGKFESLQAPNELLTRRRGRPQGTTKQNPKVSTTIRLSPEVISAFKCCIIYSTDVRFIDLYHINNIILANMFVKYYFYKQENNCE